MLPHPPPGPARRRLVMLTAAAFVALVVGIAVGAGSGGGKSPHGLPAAVAPPAKAVERAKGLSLERQIGELLVIAFHGPGVPSYVKQALRQGRASGVVLFRGNAGSESEMRTVTTALQRAGRGRVLIAADQEGARVRILPWAAPSSPQTGQATPAAANAQATAAARDLARSGVN